MISDIDKHKRYKLPEYFMYSIFFLLFCSACEISTSVPFEYQDYKPVLIIHGAASPQSGGLVLIRYNKPLFNLPGRAPDLPTLEVNLLSEDSKVQKLTLDSISLSTEYPDRNIQTAYFRMDPDSLKLASDISYSLEVIDVDQGDRYLSSRVRLPEQPQISSLDVICTSYYQDNCTLTVHLGAIEEPVPAILLNVKPPDSIVIQSLYPDFYNRLFTDVSWPDIDIWDAFSVISTFDQRFRIGQDTAILLSEVNISVAYLSQDLATLLHQVNQAFPPGEDIFANPQPFQSNFDHTTGIFGLYNEVERALAL